MSVTMWRLLQKPNPLNQDPPGGLPSGARFDFPAWTDKEFTNGLPGLEFLDNINQLLCYYLR